MKLVGNYVCTLAFLPLVVPLLLPSVVPLLVPLHVPLLIPLHVHLYVPSCVSLLVPLLVSLVPKEVHTFYTVPSRYDKGVKYSGYESAMGREKLDLF